MRKCTNGKCLNELHKLLNSAESGTEMLEMFEKMEPSLEEEEVGYGLVQVAQRLDFDGHDPEKVFSLAKRSLDIFLDCESRGRTILPPPLCWVFITWALCALGSSCYKLKKYDQSLEYLEYWADRYLKKLEEDGGDYLFDQPVHCILFVQFLLSRVKKAMGRVDECVLHLRKILEVTANKKGIEEDSLEIGKACMDVCEAYTMTMNAHEGLPFALKSLDIYVKHKGSDSGEVAIIRGYLGVIYCSLGQSEKALEQSQLASSFFGSRGCTGNTLHLEYVRANKLIQLGRYEESIGVLQAVVSSDKVDGSFLARASISMAKAYFLQEKFEEARALMETAKNILEMEEIEPFDMAVALGSMAWLHDQMNDTDTAISLLRRTLALPNLPEKLIIHNSRGLFVLINLSDMGEQAIQYLEEAVEKLKLSLGPKHWLVGNGYFNMGVVATKLHKLLQALIYLRNAKHILDASIGPHYVLSLLTSQMICMVYSLARRHARAIECQEVVIEGLKELGPCYEDTLDRAVLLLHDIRGAASL